MVRDHDGSPDVSPSPKKQKLSDYTKLAKVSEYGVFAKSVAIYQRYSVPRNLSYLFCGVVEEFCEFKEAAAAGGGVSGDGNTAVLKELGDVVWYLTTMCSELNVEIESLIKLEAEPLGQFEYTKVLEDILLHIGTIGGKIKKSIRDDGDEITREKGDVIIEGIMRIFHLINTCLCPYFKSTLLTVMELNVQKTQSRWKRGVVKGDGDNR